MHRFVVLLALAFVLLAVAPVASAASWVDAPSASWLDSGWGQ
jgi:hypothetical protein